MVLSQRAIPSLNPISPLPHAIILTYEILVHLKTSVSNKRALFKRHLSDIGKNAARSAHSGGAVRTASAVSCWPHCSHCGHFLARPSSADKYVSEIFFYNKQLAWTSVRICCKKSVQVSCQFFSYQFHMRFVIHQQCLLLLFSNWYFDVVAKYDLRKYYFTNKQP